MCAGLSGSLESRRATAPPLRNATSTHPFAASLALALNQRAFRRSIRSTDSQLLCCCLDESTGVVAAESRGDQAVEGVRRAADVLGTFQVEVPTRALDVDDVGICRVGKLDEGEHAGERDMRTPVERQYLNGDVIPFRQFRHSPQLSR